MHIQESVLENEKHETLFDFVVQTEHQIPVRKSHPVSINKKKKNCYLVDFVVPVDYRKRKGVNNWILSDIWKSCNTKKWLGYQL